MTGRRLRLDDNGFTLVELMIVTIVLAIIMIPLVSSFTLGIASTKQAIQDTANSVDSQVTSIYFDRDVASADTVSPSTTSSCGGNNTVVQFAWHDGTIDRYAAYVTSDVTAANSDIAGNLQSYQLTRIYCDSTGASVRTVVAQTMSAAPTLLCDGSACASSATPLHVTLQIMDWGPRASTSGCAVTPTPTCFYTFTLSGTRRVTS